MNQEKEVLLLEMIEIITQHLLEQGDFCGSSAGRRLRDLRWQLLGVSRDRTFESDRPDDPLVTRMLTLPVEIDNALGVAAAKAGVSRNAMINALIERAIEARNRR